MTYYSYYDFNLETLRPVVVITEHRMPSKLMREQGLSLADESDSLIQLYNNTLAILEFEMWRFGYLLAQDKDGDLACKKLPYIDN